MMQGNRTETYEQMSKLLNEKQWRQYLALETKAGSKIEQVAAEAGVSQNTIRRGLRELEAGDLYTPGARQCKAGGGRKRIVEKDDKLLSDLEGLLDPKGDPMSLLKWTTKSVAHLKEALQKQGHQIADTAIRRLLRSLGYSLRAISKANRIPTAMRSLNRSLTSVRSLKSKAIRLFLWTARKRS